MIVQLTDKISSRRSVLSCISLDTIFYGLCIMDLILAQTEEVGGHIAFSSSVMLS